MTALITFVITIGVIFIAVPMAMNGLVHIYKQRIKDNEDKR